MGFFSYLTVNQFGLGIFRSLLIPIQVVLIAFALFDLVYFRYQAAEKGSFFKYFLTAIALLIIGLITASRKQKKPMRKLLFLPCFLWFW